MIAAYPTPMTRWYMRNNASGALLAQYVAADALANEAFKASDSLQVEITRIVVCNTGAGSANFSLFHDDTGSSSFVTGTALYYAVPVSNAAAPLEIFTEGPNGGIHMAKGAQLGVTDSSSGDLTVSIYGLTQQAFEGRR